MNKALIDKLLEKAKAQNEDNNFERAFELYEKALAFGKRQGLDVEVNKVLIEIGLLLKQQSVTEDEVEYLDKAVTYFEVVLDNETLLDKEKILLLIEIAEAYLNKKGHRKSEKFYLLALELATAFPLEQISIYLSLSKLSTIARTPDKTIEYLHSAEKIIETNEVDIELKMQCFQSISDYYVSQASYSEILKYALKVIDLAKQSGNGEYEAKALNTAAIPYAVRGEYKEAFEYMKAALEKAESLGLRKIIASTLVNIANIFAALYSYEEAIRNYLKVLENYKEELRSISIGITYFNLGSAYFAIGNLDKAEKNHREALKIGNDLRHKLLISRVYFELVKIYIENGDLETAISYSFEAEKVYPKEGNRPSLETYLANQTMLSFLREEYTKAIDYGNEAIFYCIQKDNLKTLKRVYKTMADTYKAMGDYKNAFDYLEQFSDTSEDFMLQMRKRRTIDLEIQYALKDKENEIQRLVQESKIDKLQLKYQEETESQNIKLKMSNQELRQFTYAISHDLKEPLRMINSFSKLWYRKNQNQADKTDKEYFQYITDGSERMTMMLQGLLDYATVGKNARPVEMVDLNKMVKDIRTILYVRIQENEAVFDIELLPTVETHKVLLFQLLQNLISNAVKFKKPDVAPVIKITCKSETSRYIISVKDNGIGIAEKHLETVFKIFKRLHTKEKYEGTGIGLSLCEKMAHHLGGEIWVESEEGVGSTFSFSLPK